MPERLTTTSYLVLGMLASRDWTAYQLAEQLDKGVADIWPRARRQMYNAPKQLLEQGLVAADKTAVGRRQRTVYSITPNGREALRAWLPDESKPPSLEFEALLRVVLAEQGSLHDLERTLRGVIDHAREQRCQFEERDRAIRTSGGGTYPERAHLFALSTAFMVGHFEHMERWASSALSEVETWLDVAEPRSAGAVRPEADR